MTTAVVVSGGGLQGLAVVKSLRRVPGLRVLVADCHDDHLARFVAHGSLRAPLLADEARFEEFLVTLCRRESVQHVFPATSFELSTLLRLKPLLSHEGVITWVSSAEVLALGADKSHLYRWLAAQGFPVLPSLPLPDPVCHAGGWIGKPLAGWGGRDILRAPTAAEASALADRSGPGWVWQPMLDGFAEYSIDFAVDTAGRLSPPYARRRLRVLGGFAVLGEPGASPAVLEVAGRAMKALAAAGACGVLNLQLLESSDDNVWVSDLNPRVGTSMPLSAAQGDGDPVAWLLGADGAAVRSGQPARLVRTLRQFEEHCFRRPDLRGVRGVVFDLDDTLIDQKAWMLARLSTMWAAMAAELPTRDCFISAMLQIIEEGERARMFDVYAERAGLGDGGRERLIAGYRAALPERCDPYPDVLGTLRQLRSRGIRVALLSDNPPASQRAKLGRSPIRPFLDATVLTGELDCSKPDLRAFSAVCRALDLQPHQLVMVGDNMARDVGGALAAGWRHAFHIQREGAFYNHSRATWQSLLPQGWTGLRDLPELDWYLEEALK